MTCFKAAPKTGRLGWWQRGVGVSISLVFFPVKNVAAEEQIIVSFSVSVVWWTEEAA